MYKYGPMATHLKPDSHRYDALLSRHLLAIGQKSPVEFPSSSGTPHQSQSGAISCPLSTNTGRSLDQGTYSVTMQPKLGKVSTEVPNLLPHSQSGYNPLADPCCPNQWNLMSKFLPSQTFPKIQILPYLDPKPWYPL